MKLAVASLLLLSAHLVSTHTCQEGWDIFKDNCYLFVNSKTTWPAADASCAQKQAHLAVVKNAEVDKWIAAQIDKYSLRDLWIGGKYEPKGNYWEWQPSGQRITYFNWAPGEPSEPARQHCLSLMSSHGHKWNDGLCFDTTPFACQKPVLLEWELFQGKNYMFFNEPQTWEKAKTTCAQSQAHLPVFENPTICPWLEEHMNKLSLKHLWINGTYETNSKMERRDPKDQSCIKMNNNEGLTFENIDCLAKNEFVCERA